MNSCTKHTNSFINLNGIPYLLAEYADRDICKNLDRSLIQNSVTVDDHEDMRTVVDISISNIGKRADGSLNILGNKSKEISLIDMIEQNFHELGQKLSVIKKGIIIRIHYSIENALTGETIKSIYEDLHITDRNLFLDVNRGNINDNAIISNFTGMTISSTNYFSTCRERLSLHIKSVELFYEVVKADHPEFRHDSMLQRMEELHVPYNGMNDYNYHKSHQPHLIAECPNRYDKEWMEFNRLYHFDNDFDDIVLHMEDIYDAHNKVVFVPCGTLQVNRKFIINPGHRIFFRFAIWTNDITLVHDTLPIAKALRVVAHRHHDCIPNPDNVSYRECFEALDFINKTINPGHHHHHPHKMDFSQNAQINIINDNLKVLTAALNKLVGEDGEKIEIAETTPLPTNKKEQEECMKRNSKLKLLLEMIQALQDQITDINEHEEECDNRIAPITEDTIQSILDSVDENGDDIIGDDESFEDNDPTA